MGKVRGKQIDINVIKQNNIHINYDEIVNDNDLTNKQFVDDYIDNKLNNLNYSQSNLNMRAVYTTGATYENETLNMLNISNISDVDCITDLISTDKNTLYAVGFHSNLTSLIIKSVDNGQSWVELITNFSCRLMSVVAVNINTIVAVGYVFAGSSPVILKTTNAGLNWSKITNITLNTVTNSILYSVISTDSNTMYAAGNSSTNIPVILKTTDAGSNWYQLTLPTLTNTNGVLRSIIATDTNTIYAVGSDSTTHTIILKSTDAGSNWEQLNVSYSGTLNSILATDINTLYAVGYDFNQSLILKSINAGLNWSKITNITTLHNNARLFDITNVDDNTLYVVGYDSSGTSVFLKSVDAGSNWVYSSDASVSNTYLNTISYTLNNDLISIGTNYATFVLFKIQRTLGTAIILNTYIKDVVDGVVRVKVNGIEVNVGGNTDPYDCYFSPDGVIIRNVGEEKQGDYLYWNNINYTLDDNDEIDFEYLTK